MTLFIIVLIIIGTLFIIGFFSKEETPISKTKNSNQNNEGNSSNEISDETAMGIHLGVFTSMMLEKDNALRKTLLKTDNTLCNTLAEKREILCFLIYANSLSIEMKFHNNLNKAFKINLSFYETLLKENKEILTSNFINSRLELYEKCNCLITPNTMLPGPGSAFLVLSHFLKIAKGNIIEKDVIDVLLGNAKVNADNIDQFLDFFESYNMVIIISNILITIKKFLDGLCKEFNV